MKEIFFGVFESKNRIFTKNLVRGEKVYGEQLVEEEGKEYREWNPFRSKLAAAIKNGLKELPVQKGSNVLYLGVAEGTTASHISDIIGFSGLIFGVDISARVMHKFIELCESRNNMLPLLADAANPSLFEAKLGGAKADLLYQDISQRNQAEIFCKNAKFLKPKGFGLIAIKAKSISQEKEVEEIIKEEAERLKEEFNVLQIISLKPFDKAHAMIFCQKK